MDCNLEKLADFFKFFLFILEKTLKTVYSVFLLGETISHFPPTPVRAISSYKTGSMSSP